MTKYTTIQGDMWDMIAYKAYGNELGMSQLLDANQKYRDYVIFPAGIVLNIPDYKQSELSLLPPWRR